ncbi:hypothetical protein GCM10022223_58200 [Kineosporia mesophila]|uniref:Uncharacterized protein n=1 Tax=Kineosporia mesophila TaxID=566012 RepID=A0ABP7AHF4_9ACTN
MGQLTAAATDLVLNFKYQGAAPHHGERRLDIFPKPAGDDSGKNDLADQRDWRSSSSRVQDSEAGSNGYGCISAGWPIANFPVTFSVAVISEA